MVADKCRMKPPAKILLGISAWYHDAAAALVVNGEIIAAAEEERFSRIKHTSEFPVNAIKYCLAEAQITLYDVDALVFYDKPLLKFERILETTYHNVPFGFRLFHKAMPVWMKGKINLRKTITSELKAVDQSVKFSREKILFTTHHLSHAASAFYPSPFNDAAILTVDGVGEWATATIGAGTGTEISLIKQMNFPHSVGLLYSSFTYFLGFKVNSGEYKLMGLSPYGVVNDTQTVAFIQKIKKELITIHEDGSIELNMRYFNFSRRLKMIREKKWEELFGLKLRKKTDSIEQEHANLALAIQKVTEEIVLRLAKTTKALTRKENLVLAGGVALNCVANGKLLEAGIFKKIWIQPAAGDAGGALGAALLAHYILNEDAKRPEKNEREDEMKHGFLGPAIHPTEIHTALQNNTDLIAREFPNHEALCMYVVDLIVANKLIGWGKGRAEFGPRALGARSIIASPLNKNNQTRINKAVKFREDFRPFAPVMLAEEAERLYNFSAAASYMQFVAPILPEFRKEISAEIEELGVHEKVKIPTSVLAAVTHVDYSSRIQTVTAETHPFYLLLKLMREKTGYGVLLNTSFNRGGEPIVLTVANMMDTFKNSNLDHLVVENWLISKAK